MVISVKIYNDNLINIFDTAHDIKKEVTLTTVQDFQKEADIEFYANGKLLKIIKFKNLPPAKARILDLPVTLELINKSTFTISYEGNKKTTEKHQINLSEAYIKKAITIAGSTVILLLLLIPLYFFISFLIKSVNKKQINNKTSITKTNLNNPTKKIDKNKMVDSSINAENKTKVTVTPQITKNPYTFSSLKETILNNNPIYFIKDKSELKDDEKLKINSINDYLSHFSHIKLKLIGHAQDTGKPENELWLSKKRAEKIKKLIQNESMQNQTIFIEIAGRGSTQPAVSNPSYDNRYLNRRVEIELISAE
jgi:outer membrane protein OmpA-like peptidoglycan-associated protein